MDFEFDKEMDAILKRTRAGDGAAFDSHPDADEIAAFTERALSDASRQRLTAHFADCGRCRTILSTTFVFEPEEATVAAAAVSTETAPLPWYRKLFVFPQLTYTMGALALLFTGFFGYVIFRNVGGDRDVAAVAPSNKPMMSERAANAPASMPAANTAAAPSTNTAAANVSATATPVAPTASPELFDDSAAKSSRGPSATPVSAAPVPMSDTERRTEADDVRIERKEAPPIQSMPQSQTQTQEQVNVQRNDGLGGVPNGSNVQTAIAQPKSGQRTIDEKDADNKVADEAVRGDSPELAKRKLSEPTKVLNGRTFTRRGGVWYDPLYKSQSLIRVRRGTDEYKALDADVRTIADKLGGTVVVISGSKAFRIE